MTLHQILESLRVTGTDSTRIEAKRAESALPEKIWRTVSAFANSPGGGVIVLGVDESSAFAVTGVRHPKKIRDDLASVCREMQLPIAAKVEIHDLSGKAIVTAEIPEASVSGKPCYYVGAGTRTGAYVRVGDGNRRLSDYEVGLFLAGRTQPDHDREVVATADVGDLDPELLSRFVGRARERSRRLATFDDDKILVARHVAARVDDILRPTMAGLLVFGHYPQQHLPGFAATLAVHPEEEDRVTDARLLDSRTLEGPIPEMRDELIAALHRNLRRGTWIGGTVRRDDYDVPDLILREATMNALVHRDLSPAARSWPIRIDLFPDRLTITSPGGLYGPITIDQLGTPGLAPTRNRILVDILEDVYTTDGPLLENRGTGIGAMLDAARRAGLPPPGFADEISCFRATIDRRQLSMTDTTGIARDAGALTPRQSQVLDLVSAHGTMTRVQIEKATGLARASVQKILRQLRASGRVVPTTRDPRSPHTAYEVVPHRS